MKTRYYNIFSIVLAFSINCVNSQNVVNFTTDEGFTSGALYNQPNWDANFQTSTWMVDASQGMVTATNPWKRAAWEQGFSLSGVGDEITFRVDLNFTGNLTAQNNPLIKIGFSASSDVGMQLKVIFLVPKTDGVLILVNNLAIGHILQIQQV